MKRVLLMSLCVVVGALAGEIDVRNMAVGQQGKLPAGNQKTGKIAYKVLSIVSKENKEISVAIEIDGSHKFTITMIGIETDNLTKGAIISNDGTFKIEKDNNNSFVYRRINEAPPPAKAEKDYSKIEAERKQKQDAARRKQMDDLIENAAIYVMKDGKRYKGVKVVTEGDTVNLQDEFGEIHVFKMDKVQEIIPKKTPKKP